MIKPNIFKKKFIYNHEIIFIIMSLSNTAADKLIGLGILGVVVVLL